MKEETSHEMQQIAIRLSWFADSEAVESITRIIGYGPVSGLGAVTEVSAVFVWFSDAYATHVGKGRNSNPEVVKACSPCRGPPLRS